MDSIATPLLNFEGTAKLLLNKDLLRLFEADVQLTILQFLDIHINGAEEKLDLYGGLL